MLMMTPKKQWYQVIGRLFFVLSQILDITSQTVCSTEPLNFSCHNFATYSPGVFLLSNLLSNTLRNSGFIPKSDSPLRAKSSWFLIVSIMLKCVLALNPDLTTDNLSSLNEESGRNCLSS